MLAKIIHICPALSVTFPMMLQLMELLSRSAEALRSPLRSAGLSSAFGRPRSCLRNNYWTAEMQSNISSVCPPPHVHCTPEAWLPNHLKYDMNEARGAGAYARITNKTCKFHDCFFLSSLQSLKPVHIWWNIQSLWFDTVQKLLASTNSRFPKWEINCKIR